MDTAALSETPDRMAPACGVSTDAALLDLLDYLKKAGYRFITPTPATHARVIARPDRQRARSLEDVLGWNLPFAPGTIDDDTVRLLRRAGMVEGKELLRSVLRVSWLRDRLFLHSAFPTAAEDSVFFGPDSYRFAELVAKELERSGCPAGGCIVDIGTGAGVGAIVAADLCPGTRIVMTDINPKALTLARINCRAAGVTAEALECRNLASVSDAIDVAMANPPYIIDAAHRLYRDGGDMHGAEISLEMTRAAVERLAPKGRFILYTGSAIIKGHDFLSAALEQIAASNNCQLRYWEIDPDVFGEELESPFYADVDRIAVVAAILTREPDRPNSAYPFTTGRNRTSGLIAEGDLGFAGHRDHRAGKWHLSLDKASGRAHLACRGDHEGGANGEHESQRHAV